MDHLSGLDASFLHLETADMPMHVGSLMLLEAPVRARKGFAAAVRKHIAARMHLADVFSKKLATMPLGLANPVWIADDAVELDHHVQHHRLRAPGSRAQLDEAVARLHAAPLDRSRPLWQCHVIDGLADGQIGFYTKLHHAALDGQGAVVLAQALLDLEPAPSPVVAPSARAPAAAAPSTRAMLAAAIEHTAVQLVQLLRAAPEGVRALAGLLAPRGTDDGGKRRLAWPTQLALAPRTPFNATITGERAFAGVSIALDEAVGIGKGFHGKLNDAVLGIVSGALRRYLDAHDALPAKSLVAAVPFSLRDEGNATINNQVGMTLLTLASDEADPRKRMHAIVKASAAMKRSMGDMKSVMPTDFPSIGLPWLMSAAAALVGRARLADSLPAMANVVVSNVPGPRAQLYLAGARVLASYPVSIVIHGLALNVTVQSYCGALDIGVVAARTAMPDMAHFVDCLLAAHAELLALARAPEAAVAPARKRAAPAKRRAATSAAA